MRGVNERLARARRFFTKGAWTAETDKLPPLRRFGYHLDRLIHGTYRGVVDKRLTFQAAALTYYSILSIVPLLAFAFAVLKGFGVYQHFIEGTVQPYLRATFGENPRLLSAIEQVLRFVDQTHVSGLGVFGALLLLYTGINLLATIESALNQIWGAKGPRTFGRRVTDYTTMLVVTPLLAFTAVTLAAAAGSSNVVGFLRRTLSLGPLIDVALKLSSLAVGCVMMISLFLLMPNARTRIRSVLVGGLAGGVLWQLVLYLYVKLQSGVAGYNALYASFAAFPIFLVWLYSAWMAVLVGAQMGAVDQHVRRVRFELLGGRLDDTLKETLAVGVVAEVTRRFLAGGPALSEAALAKRLHVDPLGIREPLDALVGAGLLIRVAGDRDGPGYSPAREPDQVRISDVSDAVRHDPRLNELRRSVEAGLHPRVAQVLRDQREAAARADSNVTLRELASAIEESLGNGPAPADEPTRAPPVH
jgi:membrane protein